MSLLINPYRFAAGAVAWNDYAAALAPAIWLKLDENTKTATASDASGNARHFSYPNGTFVPSDIPDRGNSPLVTGSTFSITTFGGGNSELVSGTSGDAVAYLKTMLTAGSWTLGGFVQTSSTTGVTYHWGIGTYRVGMSFNFDFVDFVNENGTLSFSYDAGGNQANALVATGTGWNDGVIRPLFFEYDSVADTISIWLGGTEIATRSRAGTKPTEANLSGGNFILKDASGITGLNMDEMLFFDKVLTSGEHAAIAAYAA